MKIFRIKFVLGKRVHTSYVRADSEREALLKLAQRFPNEPDEIRIESIEEEHGTFVIGSDSQRFTRLRFTLSVYD